MKVKKVIYAGHTAELDKLPRQIQEKLVGMDKSLYATSASPPRLFRSENNGND